jgi:tRNA A37 methylthiotransferase MiaB
MASLKTVTLGCKVNQYETEYVREGLLSIGYRDAVQDEGADLCVVNTCTVTAEGDAKSRQVIRRLARDNPGLGSWSWAATPRGPRTKLARCPAWPGGDGQA